MQIPFFDIRRQYHAIKQEIDEAVLVCLENGQFIGGDEVKKFEHNLAEYLQINHVIACGNGTDALQLALMSLGLPIGSKIIIPAFTYIAPIEVAKFLGYEIIFADVDKQTFNINLEHIKKVYTDDVRAVAVVHLFGQICSDIDEINQFCLDKNIFLIEDNAQSISAEKIINRNSLMTTSFFPTKNLGAFGDGGAVLTNDEILSKKIRQIASHGQTKKYEHTIIGINSRLDTLQAAILNIKLQYLDRNIEKRKEIANLYNKAFASIPQIETPKDFGRHTFHQYTLKVDEEHRDNLKEYLKQNGIETNIYYPIPAHLQSAYLQSISLPNTEMLCKTVLSLPIFPELKPNEQLYIIKNILDYFQK